MHSKNQTIDLLRQAFESEGYLTYKIVFKYGVYQHDIKKYFRTLENACHELNIVNVKKLSKDVKCVRCNKVLIISKYSLDDFDRYCDDCKIALNNSEYDGLQKNVDYLECPACGFRTQTLEAHFRKSNKTWSACKFSKEDVEAKFGELRMFAPVIDKKAKDKRRQNGWYRNEEETKKRMSASGGKQILGKTKENCEYVRRISEKNKARLALIDIRKYKISKDDLEKTKSDDGINSFISSEILQIPQYIVGRLCKKFNIKISRKWKFQTYVIKTISKILNSEFIEEFQFKKSRLRYDGCFSSKKLLVEANGYQHYVYPNHYHRSRQAFEDSQERDRKKELLAKENGCKFLSIGYKDDFSESSLRNKLSQIDIL